MQRHATVTQLKVASAIVIGFGILGVLATHPATSEPMRMLYDVAFWPGTGARSVAAPETKLALAISGGLTIGWGVMLWLVATQLYPREPKLTRTIILASVGTWFAVDSAASVVAGAPFNTMLNLMFLLMFYLLLRKTAETPTARSAT